MAVVISSQPHAHAAATPPSHTPTCITASNSPRTSPSMSPHSLSPQLTKTTLHAHTHSNMSSCSTTTTSSGIISMAATTSHTPIRSREVSLSTSQTSSVLPEGDKTFTTISPQLIALAQQPVVSHSTHLRTLTHIPPFLISSYIHSQTAHDEQYHELQKYIHERELLEQELNRLRDAIPIHMACQEIVQYCAQEDPFEEIQRLEEEEKRMQKSCGGCNIM